MSKIFFIFSVIFSVLLIIPTIRIPNLFLKKKNVDINNAPNIILIVSDALAAEDMSLYGYDLETTPYLSEEAKQWTVFTNANSPITCTVSYFPSIMTGKYPYYVNYSKYGAKTRSDSDWNYLPEILVNEGYQNYWINWWLPIGLYDFNNSFMGSVCEYKFDDVLQETQFAYYLTLDKRYWKFPVLSQTDFFSFLNYKTCWSYSSLEDFLSERSSEDSSQPFFIYMHYQGVHGIPYPSGEMLGVFLPPEEGLISRDEQAQYYGEYNLDSQAYVDRLKLRYDEAILNNDQKIKEIIDALIKNNYYENSIIIVTADHGQNFYNGYSSHCTPLVSYYETHIPLLIKYPYQTIGKTVETPVSSLDIFPTIMDYLNIQYSEEWFDGESLVNTDLITEGRYIFSRRQSYSEQEPHFLSVFRDGYKLIRRDQEYFLYNVYKDPKETNNLIGMPKYKDIEEELREAIDNF